MRNLLRIGLGAALLLVAGAALVVAFSGRETADDRPSFEQSYERAGKGLCEAARVAAAGDHDRAYGLFVSRSHTDLHALADRVSDIDRSAAARLLEAKAAVESSLPAGRSEAATDLRKLTAETEKAVELLSGESTTFCTDERGRP